MACLRASQLTALQSALLDAFFRHEQRMFLTGGAALAGFHLGHRTTEDLDLFGPPTLDLRPTPAFVACSPSAALRRASSIW